VIITPPPFDQWVSSGILTIGSYPMLAGNVAALLTPLIFVPILTYAFGRQDYNWESMKNIKRADDDVIVTASSDVEQVTGPSLTVEQLQIETGKLERTLNVARMLTVGLTVALLVLWPMPMYGSGYIFSPKFFTGWVSVGFLWLFCSGFGVVIFPVFEGRLTIVRTVKGIFGDITGKRKKTAAPVVEETDNASTGASSVEKITPKA
jgi:hypothetical protein